uniref:DYW domain-containing protein n=1 Tax=Arcella intermedia TaxID=1963864 RepID=A0A6B2L2B2_9EUKA
MLSMYAKKGDVMQAERVWSELEGRGLPPNLYLYTTIISLYARAENSLKVEELWKKMALDGISPDLEVYTTLLTLYAKVGEVAKSEKILKEMEIGGFKLDLSVYCTLLSLYANTGNIELGRSIHCKLLQNDWNEEMGNRSFNYLTASLIMLYSSCGDVGNARKVFDSAMVKKGEHFDIAVWNAMINGYALHGYGKEALEIYEQLCAKGFSPNHLTFTSLLTALSHAILPEKALEYINIMTQFGLTPDIVQHTCVVDAFARGGKLEEAEKYIGSMSESNVITWLSLLGACRLHGDLERGERVAKEIFKRWPMNTAAYVLLGNIYASKGMHMERDLVRKNMEDLQLKKVPGMSWIYIDGKMNRFLVSDKNHPEIIKIRNKMNELYEEIKKAGFIPRTHYVLKDVKEEMLEKELCGHSEKLAIAYGLLKCSFNQKDITIYKNLRVCGDCHEATKWISKVIGKTIKLRDTQRWHNFSDGKCSCNDCW